MLKKFLLSVFFIMFFSTAAYASDAEIDLSKAETGVVKINYVNLSGDKLKIMVQKGEQKVFYDFGAPYQYPLNFGTGEYTVAVLKNIEGVKYESLAAKNFEVDRINPEALYLNQTEPLHWNEQMLAVIKAKELVEGATTNKAKAEAIYQFLVKNMKYDYDKLKSVKNGYKANPETTFKEKQGICVDIATLYAVMLRSVGVPVKLAKGYKNDITVFHAWNQVYLEDTRSWVTVDITYDNTLYLNKKSYSFIKNTNLYRMTGDY